MVLINRGRADLRALYESSGGGRAGLPPAYAALSGSGALQPSAASAPLLAQRSSSMHVCLYKSGGRQESGLPKELRHLW